MKGCIVEGNEIPNVIKRMADGGGIYINGNQRRAIIRNNYIHDIIRHPNAQGSSIQGIFFDQGCSNVLVENNRIENTRDCTVGDFDRYYRKHHEAGKNIIIKDFSPKN